MKAKQSDNHSLLLYTVDFGYEGLLETGSLVPYIRMSLISDGNYVHFGQTDRERRPSSVKDPYIRSVLYSQSLMKSRLIESKRSVPT